MGSNRQVGRTEERGLLLEGEKEEAGEAILMRSG